MKPTTKCSAVSATKWWPIPSFSHSIPNQEFETKSLSHFKRLMSELSKLFFSNSKRSLNDIISLILPIL